MILKMGLYLSLLVVVLLLPTSCGGDETSITTNETENKTDKTEILNPEETAITETAREPVNLPNIKYSGYEYRILTSKSTTMSNVGLPGYHYWSDFGYNEERSGEPINDAVYARNLAIEEKYDVKISVREAEFVLDEAKKIISAGENLYDIIMPVIDKTFSLAESNYIYELNSIPYIDLTKPWWDTTLTKSLSLGNKIYVATGDISMEDEEQNSCIVFNKMLISKYNFENPYDLTRDGKWTLDKMYKIGSDTTEDINGDGIYDRKDKFGYGEGTGGSQFMFTSCGGKIAEINSDGVPMLTIINERTTSAMEKIIAAFNDPQFMIWVDRMVGVNGWNELRIMFKENRMMFLLANIYVIKELREMIDDFGIVPSPKYDEIQENYASLIATDSCNGLCVPITIADIERTGILTEAIAYESKSISNAYYDVTLAGKFTRDSESLDMLKIVFDSRVYDIGKIFGWGDFIKIIDKTTQKGGGFASACEANREKAEIAMKAIYDAFMEE